MRFNSIMIANETEIQELKDMYWKHYQINLNDHEASELAQSLILVFELLESNCRNILINEYLK